MGVILLAIPTRCARILLILLILLVILLKLLEVFLQVGGIARSQVSLDLLQIGLELLSGLLSLAIIIAQGLPISCKAASILWTC